MYDSIKEDARGFLIGLLLVCALVFGYHYFKDAQSINKDNTLNSIPTMTDVYIKMSKNERIAFLKSYFENKVNTGYYMLVSQEAAFYQILSENGVSDKVIESLINATGVKPKVLIKTWETVSDKLDKIDTGILSYYNTDGKKKNKDDIVIIIDKIYLDILAEETKL